MLLVLGHFVQAGPITTVHVFPLRTISYTKKLQNLLKFTCVNFMYMGPKGSLRRPVFNYGTQFQLSHWSCWWNRSQDFNCKSPEDYLVKWELNPLYLCNKQVYKPLYHDYTMCSTTVMTFGYNRQKAYFFKFIPITFPNSQYIKTQ